MKSFLFSFLALFLVAGCKSGKIYQATPITDTTESTITETRNLDTLVVTAPKPDKLKTTEEFALPKYNPTYKRRNDLVHTKLDLKFNWAEQQVLGKATLTFKPQFYPVNQLRLDAKGFDIHKVTFGGQSTPLKYEYDDAALIIDLGKEFTKDQTYDIYIEYTANPAKGERGGSAAITSDQGLFFINHDESDPNKPMQIWTQGETEWNSRWFPTVDKPNERCTQEMYLTVDDKFKTLSNGLLQSSKKNSDGTRTDYWKMDLPHAPYLFMIAVGEFAVVKDTWNGMTVDYYVEPEYESSARGIFSNTIEMLDFFSNKLGVKYPWQKYSQVIVRDYVSGAMENTTGVIFGEFVQKTDRELIDNHNERIVAHELFHHWFGDLVTCESWANLTMNEGFANYSEYLWFEHKYGKDAADNHLFGELQGYLGSAGQQGVHPLIHFGYNDKEDMFDAHSYNKGGLVLHMLRNYVGDEAFFAALNLYLKTHQYTSVEAHDLRLAFEDVTGEDMNWFFNQWYFSAGHPTLKIESDFNAQTSSVDILLEQTQNTDQMPAIFQLPLAVDIYLDEKKVVRKYITMTERKQSFSFQVPQAPKLVNVDAEKTLLGEKQEDKTEEEYIFQYNNAPKFLDQYEATAALAESVSPAAKKIFNDALKNDFWVFRAQALEACDIAGAGVKDQIFELAKNDPHSSVRAVAIEKLAMTGEAKYLAAAKKAIDSDKAYPVIGSALEALKTLDFKEATAYAKKLEGEENSGIVNAVGAIYAESGDLSNLGFFEKKTSNVDGYDAMSFLENYLKLAKTGDGSTLDNALLKLKEIGVNPTQSPWRRLGAYKSISDLSKEFKTQVEATSETNVKTRLQQKIEYLTGLTKDIASKESNDQLKAIYKQIDAG